jgi:hypothetical protein
LIFPVAVAAVTDPIRVLDYYDALETVTVQPGHVRLYRCNRGSELTEGAMVRSSSCIRIEAPEIEGTITYLQSEPAFHHLARLLNADQEVKLWYSRRPVRTLFTPLGTLRAAREGEVYHVDVVNTLLHRHRVAAQSAMVGAGLLLLVIPFLMFKPVASYLRRYRARAGQARSRRRSPGMLS